jgi:hypothetical protein
MSAIDVGRNFWANYRKDGKDPDQRDPVLRSYHRMLWSKPLPNGRALSLDEYLHHSSESGDIQFSSDSFMHTYQSWKRYQHVISRIPKEETEHFYHLAGTIGGIMIFPSNKVDGKRTINGEKGCNGRILDRIDLTLECIRRHYEGGNSPLSETLERYSSFFDMFIDFKGYADFFLMQDMVTDGGKVKFLCSFDDFNSSPLPKDVAEYILYKDNAVSFLNARNGRIRDWAQKNL